MHIGLDGRFWSRRAGGLSTYSRELVKNLLTINQKNEYFLFLLPKDYLDFDLNFPNLKKVKINSPHYSIAEQIKLPFELKKIKLDFSHFLNFNHPIFWLGKFVITFHDLTLFFYPVRKGKTFLHRLAMRLVMASAINRAIKIIVPSKSTKNDLIKNFNIAADKIVVTYEGVSKEFRPLSKAKITTFKKEKKLSKPFLLYIGQWRRHKNLIRLIEAFEIARKKSQIDFQLVIGGKPDFEFSELNSKIKNSPFKKEILCPGFIADKELALWYNAAEAFVFPSLYEGFGLPPLEAMNCGTPVIASNVSSLPEVLGRAVKYFNPHNVSQIAKSMIDILEDKELRQRLRKKALIQAQKFSFEKMAQETLKVYNNIK